jgi:hypothetical protein
MIIYHAETQQLLLELEDLPPSKIKQLLLFARFLKQEELNVPLIESTDAYDFSDLSGKLAWRGDAVAIQRQLRDA